MEHLAIDLLLEKFHWVVNVLMLWIIDTGSYPSLVDWSPFKSKNPVMSSSFTDLDCSDAWNQKYTSSPSWLFDFLINQVFSLVVEIDIFFVHKSNVKSTHNSLYLSTIPAIYWIIVYAWKFKFYHIFHCFSKANQPTHSFVQKKPHKLHWSQMRF